MFARLYRRRREMSVVLLNRWMDGLSNQTHPERSANPVYSLKSWLAAWPKGLVQGFTGDAGGVCDVGHAASASDIAQRSRQKTRVVRVQYVGEVGRNGLFTV